MGDDIGRNLFRIDPTHFKQINTADKGYIIWPEQNNPPVKLNAGDLWLPGLTPSRRLLDWFSYDQNKWHEFYRRYEQELMDQPELCEKLRELACRSVLILIYQRGTPRQNIATAIRQHLIQLECKHRWNAGLMIGGYASPVEEQIRALGGIWFAKHKVWMMPDETSWQAILNLLPGDF